MGVVAFVAMTFVASYLLIKFGFNLLLFLGFIVPVWLSVAILTVTIFWKKVGSMTAHVKKRLLPVIVATIVLLFGLISYLLWSYNRTEQIGSDKFMRAWVEFEEENPGKHICVGGLLQTHSYSELGSKSIAQIKELIAKSSYTC